MKHFPLITVSVLAFSLFACGGGGREGTTSIGSPINPVECNVYGLIQKGPFIRGATIDIQELNDSLVQTGRRFSTQTVDDLGNFSIPVRLDYPYVDIIATGYYFDEVNGKLSNSQLTLRSIYDLSIDSNVNVNILTNLSRSRIIQLISSGKSFSEAKTQTESEVLRNLNISASGLLGFEKMDVSQIGSSNAVLLTISSILLKLATINNPTTIDAELSQLAMNINSDLMSDGIINDINVVSGIKNASVLLNADSVASNLLKRYESLGITVSVPDINPYLPIPVENVNVTTDRGGLETTVSWTSTARATSYNIYWSNLGSVSKTSGTKIEGVSSPYGHAGLSDNVMYYYIVTAVYDNVESRESQTKSVWVSTDIQSPTILSTDPPNNTTGINYMYTQWTISATFDEVIDETSFYPGIFTVRDQDNNVLPGTIGGGVGSKVIRFNNSYPYFCYCKTYTATINAGIKDLAGNAMGSDYIWRFTTISPQSVGASPSMRTQMAIPEVGQATILWYWGGITGLTPTKYNLYWSTSPGVTKTTGNKIENVTSPYVHSPLSQGIYYYTVTAVVDNCETENDSYGPIMKTVN